MLQELHVKNLALIEEASLEFGNGLHVLTGETGAGKSLLLGSLSMAMGAKTSSDLIRNDCDYALSELSFSLGEEELQSLKDMDIYTEDGTVILQRRLSGGRSVCRINGETVPAVSVKHLAEKLIDIHGQHDHQSLLKKSNHLGILDAYVDGIDAVLQQTSLLYQDYNKIKNEIAENECDEIGRNREISFLEHEVNEISEAKLTEGEDEILEERFKVMLNASKITESVSRCISLLKSDDGYSEGAVSLVGRAERELAAVLDYDEQLTDIKQILNDAESLLGDAASALMDYMDSMTFDQQEFYEAEQRLNVINKLKDKYGKHISDILAEGERAEQELAKYSDYDAYMDGLRSSLEKAETELDKVCATLSDMRKKGAAAFENEIKEALKELNFGQVEFEIDFKKSKEYTAHGNDDVEFLISLNPGEKLKPLSEVASGGELSRIMLAIRTISAARDGIGTLIFDEIDAGISGYTSTQVAKRLSDLSKSCQVICITHQPQIAAFADHHYRISKSVLNDRTTTQIEKLKDEEMLGELVRLLGDTPAALENAKQLKERAAEYKKQ